MTSINGTFGTKTHKEESIESADFMDVNQSMLQKSALKKNNNNNNNNNNVCQQSPRKQFNTTGNKITGQHADGSITGTEHASSKRFQRNDLTIVTDLLHQQQHDGSSLVRSNNTQSAVPDNNFLWNTPPANCKMPNPTLSRRASLATVMVSPSSHVGYAKSSGNHGIFAPRDFALGDGAKESDGLKHKAAQKRFNNISGPSRRHSVPNLSATRQTSANNGKNTHLQRVPMGTLGIPGEATDGSYLPTPTDSTFHSSINGEQSQFSNFSVSANQSMAPHLPPTPSDVYFTSGIHPFDLLSGASETWENGNSASGIPPVPPSLSAATKSATIQYLQQLQQSIALSDGQYFPNLSQQPQQQQQNQQQQQYKQLKTSQSGPQSRRGSKAKAKRRVGSLSAPAPPMLQPYMTSDINWSLPTSDQQLLTNTSTTRSSSSALTTSANSSTLSQRPVTSATTRVFYHGPAPCGNPDPLYEYLASPTIVPGLEIIGHDFYGNYVQILPICPDTTCSMNQDPVYLNLLQAIYAHTIPFLDLAPGSEEESQLLNNGTPSAITTQSIQPPFKNLLPLNGPAGQNNSAYYVNSSSCNLSAALSQHSTLTSSVSSPSLQQVSNNGINNAHSFNKLLRRASMASISSISSSAVPNSRRSSITSNLSLNNPAKKKKNIPRTHPYKSTSSFKEDNPMVTEAILTQVGGLGGIGNSATVSATDPRHKIAEKMVHMDEAEYAAHYTKHQQVMNKSASTTALCLAQTLVSSMVDNPLGPLNPSSLMSPSVTAPSITNALTSSSIGNNSTAQTNSSTYSASTSPLDSIAAADFIKALSECSGGMGELGLQGEGTSSVATDISLTENDLLSLENLMMMDSNAAAAVQAAAATAWPNWFDLNQLEKDVCEAGMDHQASAFSSASCSIANLALSTSSTLTSFTNSHHTSTNTGAKNILTTNLLLSSSTNLAIVDDLIEDSNDQQCNDDNVRDSSDQDTVMTMVPPSPINIEANHNNSTSQVLVFDQISTSSLQQTSSTAQRGIGPTDESTISMPSSASTDIISTNNDNKSTTDEIRTPIPNDLALPYTSSLLTVLPFSAQHSHPIFPTRGNRRSGWYRSKSVASQGLSQITGVDYTTTCWYDVERLQSVVRDSISFQESSVLQSLEDLTEPSPSSSTISNIKS
ncbi:hypothetical protein FBU30_010031 [Linnemannia zychae]|nr:hypothetical protein FBU30_010031 [Linnemannia zychae]